MKRLNRNLMVVTAVGLAGAVVACDSSGPKPPPGAQGDVFANPNYPQVVMLDGLQQWVVAGPPIVVADEGRPLDVTVPIRAETDYHELAVQYRFGFYDVEGRLLEPQPDWSYLVLPIRAQRQVRASALSSAARDWRLEVRPAR